MNDPGFAEEQKQYLQGFLAGTGLMLSVARGGAAASQATFAGTLGQSPEQIHGRGAAPAAPAESIPAGPEAVHFHAQDRQVAEGKNLCPEEVQKRKRFPLDVWDDIRQHAAEKKYPQKFDILAFKYHGLFYVAPTQDSYMVRLRFPGGIVPSHQMRRAAGVAERYGGGYAHVTTRANLQLREITAADPVHVLEALHEAGIINRGAGADNIRNITGSPTAGVDPQELFDTRPLTRELYHYILNHREMYGLPRKFNIAFDGGGRVSSVADTNDVGFTAVAVAEGRADGAGAPIEPGVYFGMALGGITGHKDFARDTGILLRPDECLSAAVAVVRVFTDHGDRTDRKKSRLKYLLDRWGHEKFVAETERVYGKPFRRLPLEHCEPRGPVDKHGHIGLHPQKQPGLYYAGVLLPAGHMTAAQMRGLADVADRHGSGTLRLTVWQNVLISDISEGDIVAVKAKLESLGLDWSATSIRAGLVACTGALGCKYAATHTKEHAVALGEYFAGRLEVDPPVNIHFTGCLNSCAQHYMGDIGLLGTKVEAGDDMVEGYHVFVGGGYGADQAVGRELYRNVVAADLPVTIEKMLRGYLSARTAATETFNEFVRRHEAEELRELFDRQPAARDAE
jgi:ferredoxin-nitrite reductase